MQKKLYSFECSDGIKRLTLKKASSKWINYDMPDIFTPTGDKLIEVSFPDYMIYVDQNTLDDMGLTIEDIYKFLESSDKAFHTKFKDKEWCSEYEQGRLTKKVVIV